MTHHVRGLHPLWPAVAILLSIAAVTAPADPQLTVKYGQDGHDYQYTGAGLRFDPIWSSEASNYAIDLRPAIEIGHMRYSGQSIGPSGLTEGGGLGIVHIERAQGIWRPYAEAGFGLVFFSNDRLGTRSFSIHNQFTEQVGLGVNYRDRWSVGWLLSHYSNGGLKEPNSGMDLQQIVLNLYF